MKQLNKEQAIYIAEHGLTKGWSYIQKARFQINQELLCMDFSEFHEAVEKALCQPVWTHMFGSESFVEDMKRKLNGEYEPELSIFLSWMPIQHQDRLQEMEKN